MHKEHAFINDSAATQGADVGFRCLCGDTPQRPVFKLSSQNIKLPVKVQSLLAICRFFNKGLPDSRHAVAGFFTKYISIYRNLAPAQKLKAFGFTAFFKAGFFRICIIWLPFESLRDPVISRKKEHPDSILAFAKFSNQLCRCLLKKVMANLNKNSNSVPSLTRCIFTGTVFKLFYNAKGIINNFMRLASVNIYNRTNTTGIVFKRRFVQSIHFHVQLQKNAMRPQVQKQQNLYPRPHCHL